MKGAHGPPPPPSLLARPGPDPRTARGADLRAALPRSLKALGPRVLGHPLPSSGVCSPLPQCINTNTNNNAPTAIGSGQRGRGAVAHLHSQYRHLLFPEAERVELTTPREGGASFSLPPVLLARSGTLKHLLNATRGGCWRSGGIGGDMGGMHVSSAPSLTSPLTPPPSISPGQKPSENGKARSPSPSMGRGWWRRWPST